jgi:hypothetical protein
MRLWTVHPRYLDAKGLVAAWREALLAQKVLLGATRGYRNHPQLERFRAESDPVATIAAFLTSLADEGLARGYSFDRAKIAAAAAYASIEETDGQLAFEWEHLLGKLAARAPELHAKWKSVERPDPHPLFTIVRGDVRSWERGARIEDRGTRGHH